MLKDLVAGTIYKIIQKLYEGKVLGNSSGERFHEMSADYEIEQKALEARTAVLKKALDTAKKTYSQHKPLSGLC